MKFSCYGTMTEEVFFNLLQPAGWVYRYRDTASQKHTEEGEKIFASCGEHDKNRLSGCQPEMLQSGGNTFRLIPQFEIGNDFFLVLITVKTDMRPFRMFYGMPFQNFD